MTALVKYSDYGPKAFLAGSIPYLQLNYVLVVNSHYVVAELHSNSDIVVIAKTILD